MAETGAIFGGEHSGHFYFRDFWRADSGMLAALHTLAALGEQDRPLSELLAQYARYVASGEINSTVIDQAGRTAAVEAAFANFGSALVNCFSASYVSRSSSMNASWSVPASAMIVSPLLQILGVHRDIERSILRTNPF